MKYQIKEITISQLIEWIKRDQINLHPPYQRNFIWSSKDQKLLIDSILKGYPLPNFFIYKKDLSKMRWMHWVALLTIPLAYIAGQAGWVVAECGRQPWAIRDLLPTSAAISKLDVGSVQTTFFIFLFLFTVMLIAEIGIMIRAIKKGPEV